MFSVFLVVPASAAATLCSVYTGEFLIILLVCVYSPVPSGAH